MTRRGQQIASLLASGLSVAEVARKLRRSQAVVYEAMKKENIEPPRFKAAGPERIKVVTPKAILDCNGKDGCPCVLCEARRWKVRTDPTGMMRDERGTGGGRSEASSDRRVVRRAIGRV